MHARYIHTPSWQEYVDLCAPINAAELTPTLHPLDLLTHVHTLARKTNDDVQDEKRTPYTLLDLASSVRPAASAAVAVPTRGGEGSVQYSQVAVAQPNAEAKVTLNPFDSDEDEAEGDSDL